MRNMFVSSLLELAGRQPNLWLLCGDLGYSVLEPFAAQFSDRFVNIGVAEQNMAGIAAGLALSGKTVFMYSIGNFSTLRCLEQIRNDVCYHNADVKVVSVGAGYAYGSQGYTHHAVEDVAILSTLPGMEVFVPCDPAETRAATFYLAQSTRPGYLRLSRAGEPFLGEPRLRDPREPRELRAGTDVAILASGPIASAALSAAAILAGRGIDCSVVSVCCLKPFDPSLTLTLAQNTTMLVTLEEHITRGGLYSTVAGLLAPLASHAQLLGLGIPEITGKVSVAGSRDVLLAAVELSPEAIAKRVELGFLKSKTFD